MSVYVEKVHAPTKKHLSTRVKFEHTFEHWLSEEQLGAEKILSSSILEKNSLINVQLTFAICVSHHDQQLFLYKYNNSFRFICFGS